HIATLLSLPTPTTYRLPHISPPFPYTTLFRSIGDLQRVVEPLEQLVLVRLELEQVIGALGTVIDLVRQPADPPVVLADERRIGLDRKSTRLNSSHQIISYAVFCLKKIKTTFMN